MINVMVSATGTELGGLFENFHKVTYIWTSLAEMVHSQPPTPVEVENTVSNSIVNEMAKQKNIQSNRHEILLSTRNNTKKSLPQILGRGEKNLADYVTKHLPIWKPKPIVPRYFKPTTQEIENSQDWETGTRRKWAGITNPRLTRKPDNPINGIRNLVPNGIRSQWTRGLTIPT